MSKKILIVDDDLNFADMARDLLEHSGWECIVARSGGAAIERVREQHPQVVLLDLNMPGMNGYEALHILKSDSRTASIPIVVCSITEDIHDIEKVKDLGADDFIHKSEYLKQLIPRLDRYLK